MNKALKAVAALALLMVFVVGCNKPDEPNQGGDVPGNMTIKHE